MFDFYFKKIYFGLYFHFKNEDYKDFIIINPPIPFFAHYLQTIRLLKDQPAPEYLRVLCHGTVPIEIYRENEFTLVLKPEGGFLNGPFDFLYRGAHHPFQKGEQIKLTRLTIDIPEVTGEGKLQRTGVEMEDAVSSPSRLHLLEGGAVGGREIAKEVDPHENRQAEEHKPSQDFLPVSLYARHQLCLPPLEFMDQGIVLPRPQPQGGQSQAVQGCGGIQIPWPMVQPP